MMHQLVLAKLTSARRRAELPCANALTYLNHRDNREAIKGAPFWCLVDTEPPGKTKEGSDPFDR